MPKKYDDPNAFDKVNEWIVGLGGGASVFGKGLLGAEGAEIFGGFVGGLTGGNLIGHYLDGRNGEGVDADTGRELDVFDRAAESGMSAESWVQDTLGATEGDGSFADKLGGFVGGATAGGLGALGGVGSAVVNGPVDLYHSLFD